MSFNFPHQVWLIGLCLMLLAACKTDSTEAEKDKVLLAKVFNKPLYLSELEGMVPMSSGAEDSSMIVNAYVERWVRESLLMHEAEKNIPKDLNIDELVRDYRASLIRHNYEKLIVEVQLDSTINESELQEYYENNKEQYILKAPIVRCHFIKLPENPEGQEELEALWNQQEETSYTQLLDYCNRFANLYMLDDSTWYRAPDLISQLPKGKVRESELNKGRNFNFSHDGYRYLLRIKEVAPKGKPAPISYVSDQATKVILHKRKLKLLEEKKEEIYQRGLQMKNIEIYH